MTDADGPCARRCVRVLPLDGDGRIPLCRSYSVRTCPESGHVRHTPGAAVETAWARAVHVARPNRTPPTGALIATVAPDQSAGLGVTVTDLDR
ncbi:hypothetical protein [Streptomyces sp. VRA16 Mangrove soil]|uniref:hypothetical protein n=1 Tax=Streptomyces sp. VRA16 Mangrove soil TaxID=2817434 RepID=UPI001A9D7A5E|nr:hypothetical protein [Streptomyces sp. VRA16 Mangrove soil]MBO1337126.1 hypothetical protein [Streptomyces sp. VRA16 Mangrove soil]